MSNVTTVKLMKYFANVLKIHFKLEFQFSVYIYTKIK